MNTRNKYLHEIHTNDIIIVPFATAIWKCLLLSRRNVTKYNVKRPLGLCKCNFSKTHYSFLFLHFSLNFTCANRIAYDQEMFVQLLNDTRVILLLLPSFMEGATIFLFSSVLIFSLWRMYRLPFCQALRKGGEILN